MHALVGQWIGFSGHDVLWLNLLQGQVKHVVLVAFPLESVPLMVRLNNGQGTIRLAVTEEKRREPNSAPGYHVDFP